MPKHAESIIASHKSAAVRATAWLQEHKSLNLKNTEALELVACVLGVSNWQTLSGLAKQGKGPRVAASGTPDIPATPPATLATAPASPGTRPAAPVTTPFDEMARRLEDFYSRKNSLARDMPGHPLYTRHDWMQACRESGETIPYWHWVYRTLTQKQAMMPWEHTDLLEWQICDAAGMYLDDFDVDAGWAMAESRYHELLSERKFPTEREAWNNAAEIAQLYAQRFHRMSPAGWAMVGPNSKVMLVSKAFQRASNDRSRVNAIFKPGEQAFILRERTLAKVHRLGHSADHDSDCYLDVPLAKPFELRDYDRRGFAWREIVMPELLPLLLADTDNERTSR